MIEIIFYYHFYFLLRFIICFNVRTMERKTGSHFDDKENHQAIIFLQLVCQRIKIETGPKIRKESKIHR